MRAATGLGRTRAVLLLGAALALASGSCDSAGGARAFRVEDRSQLVGGPAAIGELGDYVMENDQIRLVVIQGGNSTGPGMFGGTIVDADLRRPSTSSTAGRGMDQFAELFPMVNLVIPGYQDDTSIGIGDLEVSIWSDGGDGRCPLSAEEAPEGCSAIRVAGRGDRLMEALGAIELLGVEMDMSFITYYMLRPGDRYVRIRTFFWLTGEWSPDDAGLEPGGEDEHARLMELALRAGDDSRFETLRGEVPIFDALLGDAMEIPPPVGEYRHPGLLAGDFLLFGKDVSIFGSSVLEDGENTDRSGFELSYLFQRRYDRGEVVLARPIASSVLVGVGDRVSYGYLSAAGSVVIPILTSSFTGTFTHGYQCVTESALEDCGDELARPLVYDRFLVIGEGDAASVLDTYYELAGLETGQVRGHVLDALSGEPLEGSRVFALRDPREWNPDADITSYDAALDALRALDLDEDGEPDESPAILSFAATDAGLDHQPDASWDMRLEPGSYLLVAYHAGRHPGVPVPVSLEAGEELEVSLAVPPAGRLHYEIFDETGDHTTAKLTFIGPLDDDAECPIDARDPSLVPVLSELRHLELGSSERSQGIATVVYSQSGQGYVDLAPGRYDVIASKGFEYSIDRRCLDLRHDTAPVEHFSVVREVDTTGWVSGDFHVHGINSFDGSMEHDARVISAVAEGIDVFATTDHDYVTNLAPIVQDLDMRDEVSTLVGIEITPIELGHLLGYPLRFDETAVDNGSPDWTRRDYCLANPGEFGCPDNPTGYMALLPDEIFQALRDLGEYGPEHTVVTVPHPRDGFFGYFDQFALNQFDLVLESPGLIRGQNPILSWFPASAPAREQFRLYSENFDAIELFNGARYEMIRTPTVSEITSFASDLAVATAEATSDEDFARRMAAIHDRTVRQVLVRTPREQEMLRYDRFIECFTHDDCDGEQLCNPHLQVCADDLQGPCSSDAPCPEGYVCEPGVVSGADGNRCLPACEDDGDCRVDEYCAVDSGFCEDASCNIDESGAPMEDGPEAGERPCVRNREPHSEGVVDDWFRLLNYGVFYTGMGNSDTHTPSSEIGLPRNYVESSTDDPAQIDRRELADNIRAGHVIASYGPFVELYVEGAGPGDDVSADGEVEIHVRVQSPSWFDVDRIEIYANGMLFCELGYGSTGDADCVTDASLAVGPDGRNTNIVNFDGVIHDDPERDTWYVAVAMGVSPQARGLSPVYFAAMHPNLGISEVIGQAFASFDVPLLAAVVPPPVPRAEVNLMLPYAITNPVFVESRHDDDDRWVPPLGVGDPDDLDAHGVPGYRRDVICQHVSGDRSRNTGGCREQPLMPLSTESLGNNPFEVPVEEGGIDLRLRRINMMRQAVMRLLGGGC